MVEAYTTQEIEDYINQIERSATISDYKKKIVDNIKLKPNLDEQKFLDTQLSADEKIKFNASIAKLRGTPSGIKGETNQKYISEMVTS